MSPHSQDKRVLLRRSSGKLASKRSGKRTVRMLSPAVVLIRPQAPGFFSRLRRGLNLKKRMAYIVLLGAVTGAYIYDSDASRLQGLLVGTQQTVQDARNFYFGA
jgi:hypothetical protein